MKFAEKRAFLEQNKNEYISLMESKQLYLDENNKFIIDYRKMSKKQVRLSMEMMKYLCRVKKQKKDYLQEYKNILK